jgi:hypothetical protein
MELKRRKIATPVEPQERAIDAMMAAREVWIDKQAKKIGRACGTCTFCCKLIPIDTKEFSKPRDHWCGHCDVGKGCKIYSVRPVPCRTWTCEWLISTKLGDHWYPAKSKMVVMAVPAAHAGHDQFEINVDTGFPNRWREEPWHSELCELARTGLEGDHHFRVLINVGNRRWIMLPDHAIEYDSPGVVTTGPEGDWRWLPCKDDQTAERLVEVMSSFQQWMQHAGPLDRLEAMKDMEVTMLRRGHDKDLATLREARRKLEKEIAEGRAKPATAEVGDLEAWMGRVVEIVKGEGKEARDG